MVVLSLSGLFSKCKAYELVELAHIACYDDYCTRRLSLVSVAVVVSAEIANSLKFAHLLQWKWKCLM